MKVGDLVDSPHHTIRGIVVEVGDAAATAEHYNNGPAVRVKWFDGDDSIEWAKVLVVISEGR
jgi:hypothetical protein